MMSETMGHSEHASRLYTMPRIVIGTNGLMNENASIAWHPYVPTSAINTCVCVCMRVRGEVEGGKKVCIPT